MDLPALSVFPDHLAQFIEQRGSDDCWPYIGGRDSDGYGIYRKNGRSVRAHRHVFELAYGWLPPCVCHQCDNPSCCNPRHLFGGTVKANHDDMNRKGRAPLRRNPTKLTAEKVQAIRAREGDDRFAVASEYGVHPNHVWKIWKRETWAWLP